MSYSGPVQTVVANEEAVNISPGSVPDAPYVLVVDDDSAILSVILLLLETEGYASLGLAEGPKVLPFLQKVSRAEKEDAPGKMHLPAVILLDLMMPGMSGYEIAAALAHCEWATSLPIIAMTADHRVTGIQNIPGATDFLSKPFRIETLLNKLVRYLPPPHS